MSVNKSPNPVDVANKLESVASNFNKYSEKEQKRIRFAVWDKLIPSVGMPSNESLKNRRDELRAYLKQNKPEKTPDQIIAKIAKYKGLLKQSKQEVSDEQLRAKLSNSADSVNELTPGQSNLNDAFLASMSTSTIFHVEDPSPRNLKRQIKTFIIPYVNETNFDQLEKLSQEWSSKISQLTSKVAATLQRVAGLRDVLSKETLKSEKNLDEAKELIQLYVAEYNEAVALLEESLSFKSRLDQTKDLTLKMQAEVLKEISQKKQALLHLSVEMATEIENLKKEMNNSWKFSYGQIGELQPVTNLKEKVTISVELDNFKFLIDDINNCLNSFMDMSVDSARKLLGEMTGNRHLVKADRLFANETDVQESNNQAGQDFGNMTQEHQKIHDTLSGQLVAMNSLKDKAERFIEEKHLKTDNIVQTFIVDFALLTARMEELTKIMPNVGTPFDVKKLSLHKKELYLETN